MADAKIRIQGDVSGFTDSMQQAERSVDGFSVSLGKVDKNANSLKAAMKTATKQAQDLAFQLSKMSDVELQSDFGQQLQAQFQTAMKAAADLKDQFGDVNQEIKNLASDTTGLDAMKEGVGVLSSGLSGLASVYGLVGGNTEEFAKALVAVNAIQNISNTITGIANALQKQSALMVGLRAAKNAILGTSIAAATAAETANTAAVGANTAATTAATAAQWSLNAAVLANPYVAAAVAIAALCAGIYLWVDSMDEATAGEAALTAATEALSAELETTMKEAGEQISLFDDLKAQYDASGAKVDEFAKKIVNNTDVQKKLGVVTKTVDDVHRLFAQNSEQYRRATLARAQALAAETAQATMLGQTLAQLSKIQAKLAAGEEVNWSELKDIVKAAGYNDSDATKIMIKAGFEIEGEFFGKDDVRKATGDFNKLVSEITKGGAYKALQDMAEGFKTSFNEINSIDFNGMLSSSWDALDKGAEKAGKTASKSAKKTKDEIKKVLTTLEGCDAIIQQAEKDMKKLDSTSATYVKDMERLKNVKLTAQVAKLQLIDKSSVSGLLEARSLIEQIMKTLPQGAPVMEELNRQLKDCDEKLYDMFEKMSNDGNIRALKEAKSQIEKIIETLPQGSADLETWARRWSEINNKIKTAEQSASDLKNGIDEGSKTWLERRKSELETIIKNSNDSQVIVNAQLELEDVENQLKDWEKKVNGVVVIGTKLEAPDYFSYRDMPQPKEVDVDKLSDTFIPGLDDKIKQIEDALEKAYAHRDKGIAQGFDTSTIDNTIQQLEDTYKKLLLERDKVIQDTADALSNSYFTEDLDKMTDRELGGMKRYIDTLIDYEQKYIDEYAHAAEQAYGVDKQLLENSRQTHEAIKKEFEKQAIYIEIKADIKQYKSQIAELQETTAKDFLGATEGLYSAFADLPKQLDECENAAEGFFKVMEAGFSIFDQIKTIIQDFKELSELFKQVNGAEATVGALYPENQSVGMGGVPQEKLDPLFERRQELLSLQKERETEASGAVAQAADQAAVSLDNLAGSAGKASGAIGAGASPQPPASEGVDMVSLAGGGADSEFTLTPTLDTDPIEDQVDQLKGIIAEGLGEGLQDALTLPEGMDDIINGMNEAAVAQEGLTAAKEAGALAQEGLTTAEQVGTITTQAGTAAATANTVATASQTAATQGQAIANVGEAVSETAKQNSKMGPFGWIAAIAAAAALFASLMSMMKFAEGGIVGGSTTIGDRVVARLNAGEMVLNKNQQSKLFKMINDGTISGSNVNVSGSVRVRGSDLEVALRNYDKMRKTNRN